jgi:phage baseplate assembly protein W
MPISTLHPGGTGPAGWAPVEEPSAQLAQEPGGPVDYEVKDFAGANGKWAELHTVDQQVDLALMIERGSLASVPEQGHTLRQIMRLDPRTIQADVEDRVKQALSRLLIPVPPSITINRVLVDTKSKGQLLVAVDYTNNVTKRQRMTARAY